MSRNYRFHNPYAAYFVSFAVIEWLDVFTRNEYKDIFLDTISYSQKNQQLEIFAWCIMSNHVHIIFRSLEREPGRILGNIKSLSSKRIVQAINENPKESRKKWLLSKFRTAASKKSNVRNYQFWRQDNKPIELWSNHVIQQKINYIHMNPVVAGIVARPEDYLYSSARDYAGEAGCLEDVIVLD